MRPIRAITDLPWWSGLPIFLLGNLIVPHMNLLGFIIGVSICLMGCWVFSKLLAPTDYSNPVIASFGMLLFFVIMLIPYQFKYESHWLTWLNQISVTVLYAIRGGLGLFVGFITFNRGFRK